ncbi:hypothetical protein BDV93DRAFT_610687 [Ceratobasidium sp. AG-I]|nr:hypothetical protein BDV93DRAFT_610687 [Ceratobasidium sp. AG-I]
MSYLPPEVITLVLRNVAVDSIHNLKPLTLLCKRWRSCASPLLLETVSVTSLGGLIKLLDCAIDSRMGNDFSYFEHYTTTIILSGHTYFGPLIDSSLLGMEKHWKTDEDLTKPDTELSDVEINANLATSLAHFQVLESLEWYGRFAGDELLVSHLRLEGKIRNLTIGIDAYLSEEGFVYSPDSFSFGNLGNLTFMTKNKPNQDSIRQFIEIAHRSPQLQSLVFQGDGDYNSRPEPWSLLDLICDQSQTDKPVRTWPNLKHLELHYFSQQIWSSEADVQKFTQFLLAHDGLESLVLQPLFWRDETSTFSLEGYPGALPNLRRLHGSLGFICGVCASLSACASLQYVFSPSSEQSHDPELFDRFVSSFSRIPRSSLKKLRISTPGTGPQLFSQLARIAPNLEFLEILPPRNRFSSEDEDDDRLVFPTGDLHPVNYIPAALTQFPHLRIVGHEPAAEFTFPYRESRQFGLESPNIWVLRLAKAVPQLEAILVTQGHMLEIVRDNGGNPSFQVGDTTRLDHLDYDWLVYHADWVHRSVSKVEERQRYKDNMNTVEEFCQLLSR